jgi:hypothetical protein
MISSRSSAEVWGSFRIPRSSIYVELHITRLMVSDQ